MKYLLFFLIFLGFVFLSSCEKAPQTAEIDSTPVIALMDPSPVSGCPGCSTAPIVPSCCCRFVLAAGPPSATASFDICGTSDGAPTTCTHTNVPPPPCDAFPWGLGEHNITLNSTNPSYDFCAAHNYVFKITNSATPANLVLQCSNGSGFTSTSISLGANATQFVLVNSNCESEVCN